jgi:hypothetical protein
VVPWSRINDGFLDGTIPYEQPTQDLVHHIVTSAANDTPWQADFYRYVALDIVCETVFDYPYPYITEKTLRPILNQRMFIVIGAAKTLDALRRRGFETWEDIIDEGYDDIHDPCDRFRAVIRSIRNFCSLDLETIIRYVQNNEHRLRHNLKTLENLRDCELESLAARIED